MRQTYRLLLQVRFPYNCYIRDVAANVSDEDCNGPPNYMVHTVPDLTVFTGLHTNTSNNCCRITSGFGSALEHSTLSQGLAEYS